jgi:uncharacterized protein YeaO (DUF488 family)
MKIRIKRVYEKPGREDGKRILVDRLWPRGLTKQKARVDLWLKQIAPSTPLRKWFAHDPGKWKEFSDRYRGEIKKNKEQLTLIKEIIRKDHSTLLYAAKDETHNAAVVLKEFLEK